MRSCTLNIIHRSFRGNRSQHLIVDRYIIDWTIRIRNTRHSTLCSSSRIVNRICPSNRRSCRQRFPTFKLNKISCISQVCCCFTRIGINGVYFRNRIILIRLILDNKLDITFVIISTIWCILVIRSYKFTFSNCSFLQAFIQSTCQGNRSIGLVCRRSDGIRTSYPSETTIIIGSSTTSSISTSISSSKFQWIDFSRVIRRF